MDTAPLVMDEIEAGRELLERLNDYTPVVAACWLRSAEGGRYLYVALEGLTVPSTDLAYGEVLRIANTMRDHYIDPFRVNLIAPTDPIARAVTEIYQRFPGPIPTRYNGPVLGGMPVAEAYIYPPLSRKG